MNINLDANEIEEEYQRYLYLQNLKENKKEKN